MTDLKVLDEELQQLLTDIRRQTLAEMQRKIDVQEKNGRKDLVTNVDKQNEQTLIERLHQLDPDARILGEEGFGDEVADEHGRLFVVDPIDGTMNFVMQQTNFAIMIAVYDDGQGVLGYIMDVMNNKLYHGGPATGVFVNQDKIQKPQNVSLAEGLIGISSPMVIDNDYHMQAVARASRGMRAYGSAGIEIAAVLNGQLNGYVSYLKPWDFGAGRVLAETLGLSVSTLDGSAVDALYSGPVLVATRATKLDVIEFTK